MRGSGLFSSIIATFLLVACTDDERESPRNGPSAPSVQEALAVPDVSGAWIWSAVEHLTLPPFVAEQIFEIEPEGPVTQLRCEASGTMNLVDAGAAFVGSGTQTVHCETRGGHGFTPPPMAAPPAFEVANGRVTGHALRFVFRFGGGALDCPYSGVVSGYEGDTASSLRATGRCIVPGHPKSPVPLDPPPAGTSKTIIWTATRP